MTAPKTWPRRDCGSALLWLCSGSAGQTGLRADGQLQVQRDDAIVAAQVAGDHDDEWRFQTSSDLVAWTNALAWGTVFGGHSNPVPLALANSSPARQFVRAVQASGLFDPQILRAVSLTFTNSNWATLLANGRTTGSNVPTLLILGNGVTVSNVGARYDGDTSYTTGGLKKSVNLDINWQDSDARVMGYRAINLNNAAEDETILREPLYFNLMRRCAPCPHGAMAQLRINREAWGVYSMVDQINNDWVDEWIPSHDGDRWRAPNTGGGTPGATGFPGGGGPGGRGGGGGFASAASAFSYLGSTVASYTATHLFAEASRPRRAHRTRSFRPGTIRRPRCRPCQLRILLPATLWPDCATGEVHPRRQEFSWAWPGGWC